jgi:hypothetical protein
MMEVETLPLDPGRIRAAGVVCCAACLLGAVGGGHLAVAGPVAGVDGLSYPHAVPGLVRFSAAYLGTTFNPRVQRFRLRARGRVLAPSGPR